MANPTTGYGLLPAVSKNNTLITHSYVIPASDSTALYIGDPIIKNGTSDSITGLPTAIRATAGATNVIAGVVVGFVPDFSDLTKQYRAASTRRIAIVCDDPAQEYYIRSAGTIAATDVGARGNVNLSTAGSVYTGRSGGLMDATEAADATYQLQIVRLERDPVADMSSAGNVAVVKINLYQDANATAGV